MCCITLGCCAVLVMLWCDGVHLLAVYYCVVFMCCIALGCCAVLVVLRCGAVLCWLCSIGLSLCVALHWGAVLCWLC